MLPKTFLRFKARPPDDRKLPPSGFVDMFYDFAAGKLVCRNDQNQAVYFDTNASGEGDVAGETHAAASKATPVNADEIPLVDSEASNVLKKLTWANLKATLFRNPRLESTSGDSLILFDGDNIDIISDAAGQISIGAPTGGVLVNGDMAITLANGSFILDGLTNAADDAAAALAGVEVDGLYHNNGALRIRVA